VHRLERGLLVPEQARLGDLDRQDLDDQPARLGRADELGRQQQLALRMAPAKSWSGSSWSGGGWQGATWG
jgi:hypothetical protein